MSKNIADKITQLIGKTPMLRLSGMGSFLGAKAEVIAKLESFNPGGSVKDRAGIAFLQAGLRSGEITKNTVIIEPTSGNTGIGLAMVCAAYGLKLIVTMPETMSIERRKLIGAYGAQIVLTSGAKGMTGAIDMAIELKGKYPKAYIPQQFENPAYPAYHQATTAKEIYEDCDGEIDYFVCGVGTGGTLTGVGRGLKEKNPNITMVAVEPAESAVLSEQKPGPHKIQGIGAGFIPKILDVSLLDRVIAVSGDQAIKYSRLCAQHDGVLSGISSGAALCAAFAIACSEDSDGKTIVVLLPDTGERYLSMDLF